MSLLLPITTLAALKLDYGTVVTLAGMGGAMMTQWLLTWSREEVLRQHGATQVLQYPKGVRLLVKGLWAIGIGLLVLAGFAMSGPHAGFALAFAAMFNAVVLALHLLVYATRITWDEFNICVHPLWGRTRVIPIHAVVACEFSKMWQQYRVRTEGHGLVKVNMHWTGVPEFLHMLPCTTPPYPAVRGRPVKHP